MLWISSLYYNYMAIPTKKQNSPYGAKRNVLTLIIIFKKGQPPGHFDPDDCSYYLIIGNCTPPAIVSLSPYTHHETFLYNGPLS